MEKLATMRKAICILTVPFCLRANAQLTFQKAFGGTNFEYAYVTQKTSDGGYIIGGTTSSFAAQGNDMYVVKFDINGNAVWNGIYGGSGVEVVNDMYELAGGGYLVSGYSKTPNPPNVDSYIIRLNSIGDTVWTKYWGSATLAGFTDSYLVTQTSDGNILVGGYTTMYGAGGQDAFLLKLNTVTGDTIWTRIWGGPQDEWLYCMQQTSDGGIILCGLTSSFGSGGKDILLIKTDAYGNIKWQKAIGSPNDEYGFGHCVQQTTDKGYILTGKGGFYLKTDSLGNIQWQKFVGTLLEGHAVEQTGDKGYIFGGTYGATHTRPVLIKTDSLGIVSWSSVYGGHATDKGWAVKQTNDGGYFLAGQTTSFGTGTDALIVKTNQLGLSGCYDSAIVITTSNPGYVALNTNLAVTMKAQTRYTSTAAVHGYAGISLCTTAEIDQEAINNQPLVYPNPSNNNIIVRSQTELGLITLYNSLGEIIYKEKINTLLHPIDLSNQPSGVYFLQTQNSSFMKIIKE